MSTSTKKFSEHFNYTENELRLFEAIAGSNALIQANPPVFTVITATSDYLDLAGKKKDDVKGRGLFEIFSSNPNDASDTGDKDVLASLQQVIYNKKKHELPVQRYDVLNEQGVYEERYWHAVNTPIFDDHGKVKSIVHSVVDITHEIVGRKKDKWIKTIEKENNLYVQAPIAIQILKGPELIIDFANDLTLSIWQKDKSVLGKSLEEVFPELKDQGIFDILKRVMKTGQPFEAYELPIYLVRNQQTQNFYFNFVYQPYFESNNSDSKGILVFATDVTENVIAKKDLKLKEEENLTLASLADASHEFIGLFSPDNAIVYINPAALEMVGWNSFKGRKIIEIIDERDREHAGKLLGTLKVSGSFSHEIRFWNEKTKSSLWFLWNVFTINDPATGVIKGLATVSTNISERKKTEEALKESHERFEASIEAVHGILWTNNAEGKMEGEQKGWARLTGQSYDEYQGYGWSVVVHPDDAQETINAWNKAVRKREQFVFEHRVKKQSGEWGVFAVRAIPLIREDGTIREWVGVHTEITEEKQAELRLVESEARFRRLADESPIFIFLIEADSLATVVYWNKTWLDYTGQSMTEALGRAWNDIIHPDDIEIVTKNYSPAFEKQQSYIIPAVRVKRNDGEYRWHTFKGNPRYAPDGSFAGYIGVGFDIHDQKLGEELIKKSEADLQVKVAVRTAELLSQKSLLDNILTHSSNGISVTEMVRDESGEVIDAITLMANDAAVKFTGMPRDIYLSKTAKEVDPNILSSPYGVMCLNTLKTGEPGVIQYFLEFSKRWLELTISKMDDNHLIHIFTDVTPIKEAQLRVERTVEDLKRSNTNLEEFAYAASHDLKEPIRKILFFGDRLRENLAAQLKDEEKNYFTRMENASKRMSSLIDDLLSYSQVSLRPRHFEEVDLNQLMELILSDLDLEIDLKKAQINIEKLCIVSGHHRQLQQAFQNLMSNAIKYSNPGEVPVINISCHNVKGDKILLALPAEEKEKSFCEIKIQDNGIGFDQADAERIFNVFTRLHGNITYRGTGVGLSIVRKVIENHNGYVTAEAKPGEGATFRVYLPITG